MVSWGLTYSGLPDVLVGLLRLLVESRDWAVLMSLIWSAEMKRAVAELVMGAMVSERRSSCLLAQENNMMMVLFVVVSTSDEVTQ